MINGSRREKMCTYTALNIIADALHAEGIETEIMFIGDKVLNGQLKDTVKAAAEKMKECDALVLGSPVYYASPSGEMEVFCDSFFGMAKADLMYKPAAAVVSARRGGTTAAVDALGKYFMITQMPMVSSTYWNMVHGNTPADVMQDEEGVQIMRCLGKNMAWMLKCIEAGKAAGINHPEPEQGVKTNFVR